MTLAECVGRLPGAIAGDRGADNQGRAKVGQILKPFPNQNDYLQVDLLNGGKRHTTVVHRLVAEAFIPNPLNLPEVNHTGEKNDNRACKLEWKTRRGHQRDAAKRNQKGIGICFHKASGKYAAYYSPIANKRKWIGIFPTKKEALAARKAAMDSLPDIQ